MNIVKKYKELLLFIFALTCFVFQALISLICAAGYDYTYHINDCGYIILSLLVMAQTIVLGLTEKSSTMILLIISNLLSIPYLIATTFTLILILIKGKKADILIKCALAILFAISIFGSFCLLITTGTFITHFEYEEYPSPSGERNVIIMEDHSFSKQIISHVYIAENKKMKFCGFSFTKEGDLLTRVYHTEDNQNDVEIVWMNEGAISINGKEYMISF